MKMMGMKLAFCLFTLDFFSPSKNDYYEKDSSVMDYTVDIDKSFTAHWMKPEAALKV